MSDNWIKFIPTNPTWQPSRAAADSAVTLLKSFVPGADKVQAEFEDRVTFFDPGANWSGVRCPVCGSDVQDWWNDMMNSASTNGFTDLRVSLPCCGNQMSLNDLDYVWPAAFGQFVLETMNPNVKDVTQDQERQLAQCIGHPLRKVWVHI